MIVVLFAIPPSECYLNANRSSAEPITFKPNDGRKKQKQQNYAKEKNDAIYKSRMCYCVIMLSFYATKNKNENLFI
ncbi:hypothetical protein QTP88_009192 [Uroleucon formosanum]